MCMTMPDERYRAVLRARDFLLALLNPKLTPKVPKAVRLQAYWTLRHFPSEFDMSQAEKDFKAVFGKVRK